MMCKNDMLKCEFEHFEGQPIRVFTDDERVHCGVVAEAFDTAVRFINKCGSPELIEYAHIAAVDEPQMRLRRCCDDGCDCRKRRPRRRERECD